MKNKIFQLSIVTVLVITGVYFYYLDNKDSVNLPKNIIEINLGISRSFLIAIPKGYLLFDTGYEKDYNRFLEILKKKKISLKEIKYILLSHHHDDHSGFVNNIVKYNPKVRVIINHRSVKLLASGKNNKNNGGGIINTRIYMLFRLKQIISPEWDLTFPSYLVRKKDIVLKDDEQLPQYIGLKAQVFYTPGHSSDSISLLIDKEYLLCGDLSSNFLNWAGASSATLFNENINEVYKSWKKMLEKKIKYIVPSHGKAFSSKRLKENLNVYSQKDLVKFF